MAKQFMMKGTFVEKDEYYTPQIITDAIAKYLKQFNTVWCPFDTEDSEFVHSLQRAGIKVIHSHISEGKDFFEYEPAKYDAIVSNPPFTRKKEVIKRCKKLGKPFAMLLPMTVLNYQDFLNTLIENKIELQLLIFDKKVSFDGNTSSFNSSFFCEGILPKTIVFERLPNNNVGKDFKPSRMYRGE